MEGLVIGHVVNNWEEAHQGSVQVEWRLGEEGKCRTGWIPVMASFVGPSYGSYHLPEIGTTVVLGFLNGGHQSPVVLGGIRGAEDTLPSECANENNSKKMWKSKSGYTFFVEEETKQLSFSDPKAENSLVWSSEEGILTLDVKEKVMVKLGGESFLTLEKEKMTVEGALTIQAESITLKTDKDITLSPGKDTAIGGNTIKLEGTTVKLKGTTVNLEGTTVKLEGTTTELKGKQMKVEGTVMEIKAQANGTIESSGMMAVKGTMLKLN